MGFCFLNNKFASIVDIVQVNQHTVTRSYHNHFEEQNFEILYYTFHGIQYEEIIKVSIRSQIWFDCLLDSTSANTNTDTHPHTVKHREAFTRVESQNNSANRCSFLYWLIVLYWIVSMPAYADAINHAMKPSNRDRFLWLLIDMAYLSSLFIYPLPFIATD